ncbi:MAG: CHAT domain-containing protein [Planktothrix agardhii KL2]|jgi:CHAT domain-containing protein|uniref:CHAT domain-containing protein n=1 Tax=Planktothrix agardhii TaxID=1160 RepID=UPI001A306AC3|nr:CHAT domain-containing protein [Planktothrix agardhii]MBG0748655.1 CHAT domain-containing protein [Planktothrix agardhii KL2]
MVDSRTQAYWQLIEMLLNNQAQKDEVLNLNQELIEKGLVDEMREVAGYLAAQGDERGCEFLRDLADELATKYGRVTFTCCIDFLLEILWLTVKSNGNQEKVYSFLGEKENQLNTDFLYTLKLYGDEYLNKQTLEVKKNNADIIFDFSNLIQKFPLGERSLNLEIAIAGYEIAGEVYIHNDFPTDQAETLNNLAVIYLQRIEGLKAENVEVAIRCLNAASKIHTRENFPERWATIQNNLGLAYTYRIKDSKAENFEKAIQYFAAASEIYTRERDEYEWARLQHNLGTAYNDRIREEKADNLEKAIGYYLAALEVRTREKYKRVWAMTQLSLGYAYDCRLRESKADNTELAIKCYEAGLEFYTPEGNPEQWAKTQNNLGLAYSHRIREDKEENIEKAIKYYQAALTVYTRTAYPEDWARVYSNLAGTYPIRIRETKEENIELAIKCCEAALQVYTYEDYPEEWAGTLNNLGLAYTKRSREDKVNNLKLAIANFELAATVETREEFPYRWAGIQTNLVGVYKELGQFKEMVDCMNLALEIYTPTSFPRECFNLWEFFGKLTFAGKQWTAAWQSYSTAIAAVEQSREWATNEAARQEIQLNAIDVYINMVQACINDGQIEKALETVERSKSRNLVELLANSELEPKDADDQLKQDLRRLRSTISSIRQLLAQADNNSTFNRDSFQGVRSSETSSYNRDYIAQQRELLQEYQRQLDEVFAQCQKLDPAFTLTQQVNHITVAEIRDLIDSHTAILEWYIGTDSFQIFIVTQSSLEVVPFDKAELEKLEAWNQQYLEALFNDTETWQDNLSESLNSFSQILRLDEILNHPALANCDSLILVPHRYLHLFPLHALSVSQQTWKRFNPETPHLQPPANPCLLDCFKKGVRYAPSCQLLQRVQQRQRPPADPRTLFAIQNPTEDLRYTDIEVEVIKRDFTPADILSKQQATKTALLDNLETIAQAHYVHFSCHGSFDFQTPLISSLILAGAKESTDSPTPTGTKSLRLRSGGQANPAKCLTLQDIFATLNLPKCRLVTLSACETGLTDTTKQSDDCIGLATGFLYAGSQGVLSSLWSVNDLATAFLMIKFYENLETADMAVALNTAQIWLRDATKEDLQTWTSKLPLNPTQKLIQLPALFNKMEANTKPFQSPDYWAAFCAVGK